METVLFSKGSLRDVFDSVERRIAGEISLYKEDILEKNIDGLCDEVYSRYSLETPVIHKDQMNKKKELVERNINRRGHEYKVTTLELELPFSGDMELLSYRPSSFPCVDIPVNLTRDKIVLSYMIDGRSPEDINREIANDIKHIEQFLNNIKADIVKFNNNLRVLAKRKIEARMESLRKNRNVFDAIKLPS